VRPALEVDALTGGYGNSFTLNQVSFQVAPGARHAVIGPNGAGKSTLFHLIAGTLPQRGGRVLLSGDDVSGRPEPVRVRSGLAMTTQQPRLFRTLTVAENVAMSAQRAHGTGMRMIRAVGHDRAVQRAALDQVAAVGLYDRRDDLTSTLSHGERRQLDLAMALATNPRVLLLDEPTAGVSAASTAQFIELVGTLTGLTLVIVEHDLDLVFGLATQVTVLHQGTVLADGPPRLVRARAEVQQAYLGDGVNESLFY